MKTSLRMLCSLALVILALLSFVLARPVFSDPVYYSENAGKIDDEIDTIIKLSTASAISSVFISALPDDTATPIANQLAELSDVFLAVLMVLCIEKFIQPIIGFVSFGILTPIAFVVFAFYLHNISKSWMRDLDIKLLILSLLLCTLIPCSLWISDTIELTFQPWINSAVSDALAVGDELTEIDMEEVTEAIEESDGAGRGGFFSFDWVRNVGDAIGDAATSVGDAIGGAAKSIFEGVSNLMESARMILSRFIKAVAVTVVVDCMIPIIVLIIYIVIMKHVFTINFDVFDSANRIRHGVVTKMVGRRKSFPKK